MQHHSVAVRPWGSCCLLAALILTPVISRADAISTQVTCSVPGQTAVVAAGSCSQQIPNQNAVQESITTSIVNPVSPSDYFVFQLTDTGRASAQGGVYGPDSVATSSAIVDISLGTAGPERSGLIEIIPSLSTPSPYSESSLSFSIGALEGTCAGSSGDCSLSSPGMNYPNLPRVYAFTLGMPFSFDVDYSNMLDAMYEDGLADTEVDFTLQFLLLENDGVTPVALSPEPSTWALAGAGLIAALLVSSRRPVPSLR